MFLSGYGLKKVLYFDDSMIEAIKKFAFIQRILTKIHPKQTSIDYVVNNAEDIVEEYIEKLKLNPYVYLHFLVVHMPDDLQMNKSVGKFSMQHCERANGVCRRIYPLKSSKRLENNNNNYLIQISDFYYTKNSIYEKYEIINEQQEDDEIEEDVGDMMEN